MHGAGPWWTGTGAGAARCRAWRALGLALGLALVVPLAGVPVRAAPATAAAPDAGPALALPELMALLASVPQQQGRFTERKTFALLDTPLEVSGSLLFRRPGYLERRTLPPSEETLVVDGDQLSIRWPAQHTERQFSLSAEPVIWAFVEAIRSTLAGDQAQLERFYWVSLSGHRAAWRLSLSPRAAGVAAVVASIELSGAGRFISRVDVRQANGERSVMDIRPD